MKPYHYSITKKIFTIAQITKKAAIVMFAAFVLSFNQKAMAQGCVNINLANISTPCGTLGVDLNTGISGLPAIAADLIDIKFFADAALTTEIPNTVTHSGTYYVRIRILVPITHTVLCTITGSIGVTIKQNPVVAQTHTPILCYGNASTVTVTATGGEAPYAGTGNFSQTNGDGTKIYTISDVNGCQGSVTVNTISQPTALAAQLQAQTSTQVCVGASTDVTATASGGNAPYTYSLNGGSYAGTNVYNEPAGSYTVTAKDANGCTQNTNQVTITQPAQDVMFTSSTTAVSCNNSTINITADGGYGGYIYKLNTGSYQAGSTFTNLTAGSYSVLVKDMNGCISAASTITIDPSNLAASLASADNKNTLCYGKSKQLITTASGGISPYTYSLNGGPSQGADSFLAAIGNYTVQVQDSLGCIATTNAVVFTQPASPLTFSTNITLTGCEKYKVVFNALGGYSGFTYSIDRGRTYQPGKIFNNVPPGIDSIRVKDANGCIAASRIILKPTSLAATLATKDKKDSICYGASKIILAAVTGGRKPYMYSLNGIPFQSNSYFTVPAGSYNVSVKDSVGCVVHTNTVTVTQPAAALSAMAANQLISCNNNKVTVTGLGGFGGYGYSINAGRNYQPGNTFNGIGSGKDTVKVKDINGCVAVTTLTIPASNLAATLSAIDDKDSVCFGGSRKILTSATGGIAPYTYSLSGAASQNLRYFIVAAGSYSVTVTDSIGCVYTTSTLAIKQPASPISISTSNEMTACDKYAVTATATGGYGGYSYAVNNDIYQSSNVLTNVSIDNQTVRAKDLFGCDASVQIYLPANNLTGTLIANGNKDSVCFNAQRTIIASGAGGKSPYTYSLDGAAYQASGSFLVNAGTYTVNTKDAVGCVFTTNALKITQPAAPVSADISRQFTACNVTKITITPTGGYGGNKYSLDDVHYQAANTFDGLGIGRDTLRIKDGFGCKGNIQFVIQASTLSATVASAGTTNVVCFGKTRQIVAAAAGSNSPFSYSLNAINYQQDKNFFLTAGTYTVTVKDSAGCTATSKAITLVQSPVKLVVNVVKTNVTCNGAGNGAITANASGGYSPYTYSLNDTDYQSNNMFSNLLPASYDITLKDSAGCRAANHVVITEPATPCSPLIGTISGSTSSESLTSRGKLETIALQLKAYPNPSQSIFTLLLQGNSKSTKVQVRVTDMFGKTVYQTEGMIGQTFRFGDKFISGMYILQVIDGNSVKTIRLVKGK